jgi:restriction endonuclease S subunit
MIRSISINFSDIIRTIDLRFTPKYFLLLQELRNLEKRTDIKIKKLSEVVEYVISGSYIPEYSNKGTPYLRVSNIKTIELDLNPNNLAYVNENKIKIPNKIKTTKGDLVIGRTAVLGVCSLINETSSGFIISQHLTRIRPRIPSGYLAAFLNSSLFKKQMEIASYGITRLELTHAQLMEIEVPILDKQYMEEIDKLIFEADKKHSEALNKINQAIQIFDKEINLNCQNIKENKTYSINSEDLSDILLPKFYYPKYLTTLKLLKKKFKAFLKSSIARCSSSPSP